MKTRFIMLSVVILAIFFSSGCQIMISESPIPSLTSKDVSATPPPIPTSIISSPTAKLTIGSKVISVEKLDCSFLGEFIKCIDETLNMEFEYPPIWGGIIEARLRTGWDSGFAYKYSFSGGAIPRSHLPEAAGLSIDFAEGREMYSLDFAGFGDSRLQINSCEQHNLYPICNEDNPDVRWMIRFPNAKYFCEFTHQNTSPIFRIEVNLPNNPTISGFVFEVPFLSKNLFEEVKRDIYSLFLTGREMMPSYPEGCSLENRKPFDEQVAKFIERLKTNSLDVQTQKNLDDLIHLAESIKLSE